MIVTFFLVSERKVVVFFSIRKLLVGDDDNIIATDSFHFDTDPDPGSAIP